MSHLEPFVFWQNIPSIHQAPLISSLALRVPVTVYLGSDLPDWRRRSGWPWPDYGAARVVRAADQTPEQILNSLPRRCVHVFSGLAAYPPVHDGFLAVVRRNATTRSRHVTLVALEGADSRAVQGKARVARLIARVTQHRHNVDRLLLIGTHAQQQIGRLPIVAGRTAPFAYYSDPARFTEPREADLSPPQDLSGEVRLIYLGRLEEKKRVDVLLGAVALSPNVALDIYGGGSLQSRYARQVPTSARGRIYWHGAIPHEEVPSLLSQYDGLCLPSDYDGWGVVVNEALLAGLRVLVSDGVGASVLVRQNPSFGSVFHRGDVKGLADQLRRLSAIAVTERQETANLARSILGADAGASELLRIAVSVTN